MEEGTIKSIKVTPALINVQILYFSLFKLDGFLDCQITLPRCDTPCRDVQSTPDPKEQYLDDVPA